MMMQKLDEDVLQHSKKQLMATTPELIKYYNIYSNAKLDLLFYMIYFRINYYKTINLPLCNITDQNNIINQISQYINTNCPESHELTTTSNNVTLLYLTHDLLLGDFWSICFAKMPVDGIITELCNHFRGFLLLHNKNINVTNMKHLKTLQYNSNNKITNDDNINIDLENAQKDSSHCTRVYPTPIINDTYFLYEIYHPKMPELLLGKIHVFNNIIDDMLLQQLEKERNTPLVHWMNGYSHKPHWGVVIPDNHLTYLLTTNKKKYPAYVSGLGTLHQGNAINIKAEPFRACTGHKKLMTQVKTLLFKELRIKFAPKMLQGNLYRGPRSPAQSNEGMRPHQDGKQSIAPIPTLVWGKQGNLIIEFRPEKQSSASQIFVIPLPNSDFTSALYILDGKEFESGGTLWHGREFNGKFEENAAGHSIVIRDMLPVTLPSTAPSKHLGLLFGEFDSNNYAQSRCPKIPYIYGAVLKETLIPGLMTLNPDVIKLSQHESVFVPGDLCAPGALKILNWHNSTCCGVAGIRPTGATSIYLTSKSKDWGNHFGKDKCGWVLNYYAEGEGEMLLHISFTNITQLRIYLHPCCGVEEYCHPTFVKFFGCGIIIDVRKEKNKKTCFVIKPHDCRYDIACNNKLTSNKKQKV